MFPCMCPIAVLSVCNIEIIDARPKIFLSMQMYYEPDGNDAIENFAQKNFTSS